MWVTDQNGEPLWQNDPPQESNAPTAAPPPAAPPSAMDAMSYWYPGPQNGAPTAPGAGQQSDANSWWWDPSRGSGGEWVHATTGPVSSGGGGGDFSAGLDPFYTAPYTKSFTPPQGSELPTWKQPDPFSYQDFKGPTADSILSDPSYQFRLDQGRGALEASAAGRGVLNSGGTLKDLLGYGQNFASQEYSNIFNRDLAAYGVNQRNAADAYKENYQTQYQDPFSYGTDRANTVYNRGFDMFKDDRNQYYTNQSNAFDKLFKVADLGKPTY